MEGTVVLKFGGASVASAASFAHVADLVIARSQKYKNVIVVVSAMGNTTNSLIELAHQVNPTPPSRELDMLVSVGERISIALLAMALAAKNIHAVSFTGSQTGIVTTDENGSARIVDVRPKRLWPCLEQGCIVIVAGFQGMGLHGDITTLGRGGSDTTAVALAVALEAQEVQFFKDVPAIYDKDPKTHIDAKPFSVLSYEAALDIVKKGARVLHERCILMAQKNGIPLRVLPFQEHNSAQNTLVFSDGAPRSAVKWYEG